MAVVKAPFLSFGASGSVGKTLTCRKYYNKYVMQKYPDYKYICTALQLAERDRMRRMVKILGYFREEGAFEWIEEIRPSIILDPEGEIYRFDMSCYDLDFGNMGLDLGLGAIDKGWSFVTEDYQKWRDEQLAGMK